jgi:hypothetical protein
MGEDEDGEVFSEDSHLVLFKLQGRQRDQWLVAPFSTMGSFRAVSLDATPLDQTC